MNARMPARRRGSSAGWVILVVVLALLAAVVVYYMRDRSQRTIESGVYPTTAPD